MTSDETGDSSRNKNSGKKPHKPAVPTLPTAEATAVSSAALQPPVVVPLLPLRVASATLLLPRVPQAGASGLPLPFAAAVLLHALPVITRQQDSSVEHQVATRLPPMKRVAAAAAGIAAERMSPSGRQSDELAIAANYATGVAAAAAAGPDTASGAASNRFLYTRNLLAADASLTYYSAATVTVTPATPEAAYSGSVTINAPMADTVRP